MKAIKVALCASVTPLLLLPLSVLAQEQAPAFDDKSEKAADESAAYGQYGAIIVTAQKRSQAINDVGMSITALGGDEMLNRGIRDTADLVKVVPGLTFTPSPYAGTPIYTMRGVGFYEFSLPASPAVTIYVDEVALPYQAMASGVTLDLERVEVLKGPQGTLFGQNATGGGINYVAAKPTPSLAYGGSLSLGRFSSLDADAYVSGPLTSTLRARAAIRTVQSGDWQKSYTRRASLGETRQVMGRLLLEWEPSSDLRFNLNLNGWIDQSDTQAGQVIALQPSDPANAYPALLNQPLAPANARAADWSADSPMRVDDRFGQASLRIDYRLSDTVDLTSVTAYQNLKIDRYSDVDATPAEILNLHNPGKIDAFSQELRLTGASDRLNWILGGNFAKADLFDDLTFEISELSVNRPIAGLPFIPISAARTSQKHESYAIFGNVEYEITDAFTLTIGGRYTKDRRDFTGCSPDVSGFSGAVFEVLQGVFNPSLPVVPIAQGECFTLNEQFRPELTNDQLKEDNFSWRVGLNYTTPTDMLLYANISRGYKAGAFATLSTSSTNQYRPIKQEELTAYEIGFKAPLANRRLQLNAAAFYYDYRDKQLRGRLDDVVFGLLEALVNVPKSRIWGMEADLQAHPIDGLRLTMAGTYVNSKIQEYVGLNALGQDNQNFSGQRFPYAPEWTLMGDTEYEWTAGDGFTAFAGVSANYRSRADAVIDPTASGQIPEFLYTIRPYTLVDMRAGIEDVDKIWKFQIWGRNVFNQYYWTNTFQSLDTVYRQAGRPATYGFTFSLRY